VLDSFSVVLGEDLWSLLLGEEFSNAQAMHGVLVAEALLPQSQP